jgi:hypothetical protein
MLWPLELPVKITFGLLVALVLLATVGSLRLKWAPRKTFVIASLFAFVGFIPSCAVVMKIVDARRFGIFQYASYDEVQDFRIERFLPTAARNITLEKTFIGHRAKYMISESELKSYIDGLWDAYGKYSAIPRSKLKEGESVKSEEIEMDFQDLNWPRMINAVRFHSPVEGDGGGATYFFDPTTGITYHRAGYW